MARTVKPGDWAVIANVGDGACTLPARVQKLTPFRAYFLFEGSTEVSFMDRSQVVCALDTQEQCYTLIAAINASVRTLTAERFEAGRQHRHRRARAIATALVDAGRA